MKGPLKGITILDLSTAMGRYCTMFLADMGADVLKVQEIVPRMRRGVRAETPEKIAAFDSTDRNKKSIALNLKTEEGRRIFYKLAEKADVVVEDFRPGVTERLGIDYQALKKVNSTIIYCSISGYGQDGPYRLIPGHDPNYEAMSGLLGITRSSEGQYVLPGVPIADFGGGSMNATIGILLALIAHQRYGVGQYIDISMLDGAISIMACRHGATYLATGLQPKPGERPPHVYETKDGKYITICCPEPWLWEKLCRALGLAQYIPYAEEAMALHADTHYDEAKHNIRQEVISDFARVFRTKTRDEWFDVLSKAGTCAAPVYAFEEVFSNPQVLHREMVVELDHPILGKVRQVGIPIKLSETPGSIRSFAPLLGENTEETLESLGYSETEIADLAEKKVINKIQGGKA